MVHFDMGSVNDNIRSNNTPADISTYDLNTKWDILHLSLKNVISNHVNLSLDGTQLEVTDKVLSYAQQVFTLL